VRKLEAAIKVYGGLLGVYPETIQKLTSMLLHPFPKVRDHVADILFVKKGIGKGVDWRKAGKGDLNHLLEELKGE
jgi:tubulin-specific chaperone D